MSALKTVLSFFAILLTFVGYIPYIRSVIEKKTIPHVYSWLVWTLDGFIIFGLQITNGAGWGSLVVLSAGILAGTVLALTLRNGKKQNIATSDTIFLTLALVALVLWLVAKQPLLSTILIMSVDFFGFVPTIRKSWKKPYSENLIFYVVNTLRFAVAFTALAEYSMITVIYPTVWFLANGLFVVMLIARRRMILQK